MIGIIEKLKAEVKSGSVKICRSGNDIIIYDIETKEFMIFDWEVIEVVKTLRDL